MDTLIATAIVGTGQVSGQELSTGTPIDTLTTQVGTGDRERKLLLMAGSLALYQEAGQIPVQAPEPPQPAPVESIPACSTQVGHLLQGLLQGEQRELLPEALNRLQQTGQRLPYELLPLALGYGAQSKEIRPALFAVLGERGRWLSQFEKPWAWASHFLASDALPADAETLWQEGTLGQRRQLLTRIRSVEPANAREWLADVWKQEKAEARAEFLSTLRTGLSLADEPFLENALNDRSESVREISAELLASIPTSALMQRMLARADALLTYTNGTFSIKLPPHMDAAWHRDGIKTLPKQKTNPHLWYARQVLTLIPPTHWEERFSLAPVNIIAGLIAKKEKSDEIGELLLVCWLYAATRFESPHWIEPLWAWWCKNPDTYPIRDISSASVYQALGKLLPQRIAEQYVQLEITQEHSEQWALVIEALPTPWSSDFGAACLDALRSYIVGLDDKSYPGGDWQTAFTRISLALPPACFDAALGPWQFPEPTTWQIQQWKNQIKTFTNLVRKRQQILKEI